MYTYGKTLFNDNWKFTLCPIDTQMDKVCDYPKYNVQIPHDWLINDTDRLYETGLGVYEKIFDVSPELLSDKLYLLFDGVYMNTTVYLNGKEVGQWKYGYSSFYFDISDFVVSGENKVVVSVKHESPNTRWYSGAGIFRNVFIRRAKTAHILENGVYIAPKPHKDNIWRINIDTNVSLDESFTIRHSLLDSMSLEIAVIEREFTGIKDSTKFFVENPSLWDTKNPVLYTMKSELIFEGEVVDTAINKIGFRYTEFDSQKGFFLNGKNIKMHGVCMHHDLGALGSAMNEKALYRQLSIMKGMGVNAIRTSHNMPARELMDICDELGLLVDSEAFDMWEVPKTEFDYSRFFVEWSRHDVESWVCRDRNHPSLIMWSIGNEIYDTHKDLHGLEIAKDLSRYVDEYDYYHNGVSTIGSNYMAWENAQLVADHIKYAGYNYGESLYDEHHEKYPHWFIYGSETASTVRSRGIYHFPADVPLLTHDDLQCSDLGNSVVGWGRSHESAWVMDRDRDFCFGQYIWTGFDYIGEPTPYSTKNSYFGIVDTAGLPKDAYYLFKAVWTDVKKAPFVHIMPYWDWNDGQIIDVLTYSNAQVVELFLNGRSLSRKAVDLLHGDVLHEKWQIPYEKGTLEAVAYNNYGIEVARSSVTTPSDPAKIIITADNTKIKADGLDMVFLVISVCDKEGNPVQNARNRVKVTVSQAGKLAGLDNGDSTDYDSYKGDNRRLFSGKLVAMIQAVSDKEDIVVSVQSKDLEPAEIKIKTMSGNKIQGAVAFGDSDFPAKQTPYTDEIPVRKIEIISDENRKLSDSNKTSSLSLKIYPENATYRDIGFKCVANNGVETNIADISYENETAIVTAKGDGNFRVRAFCKNGGDIPQVCSEIEYSVTGLGDAIRNPYKYTAACLFNLSNYQLNSIERGALSGIKERAVIGFTGVDFGKSGSDILVLYIGNNSEKDIPVELWLGNPDENGRKITTLDFPMNNGWDKAQPYTFKLPETIKGVQTVSFVLSQHCIFGGFQFEEINRAFSLNNITENDNIYGDDFIVAENRIENIGNNVLINFNDMDFGDGVTKIKVTGKTPIDNNTIQIRYSPSEGGAQKTQLLEFKYSEKITTREFTIEKISGKNNIDFVFLPGSKFDFESFIFSK